MKIDSAAVSRQTGAARTGGSAEARMRAGDIVQCEVLSKENGVLRLRTREGGIIKARLEDGVVLSEGDSVRLVVIGKKDGVVYLSTDLDKAATAGQGSGAAVQDGAGTADTRIMARLRQLNIPVREELLVRIRELIAAYPNMTADEAVFLASNKITAGSPMLEPMLSLLGDGAKLDKMIASLLTLLQDPAESAGAAPEAGGRPGAAASGGAPGAVSAGMSDWAAAVLGEAGENAGVIITAGAETPAAITAGEAETAVLKTGVFTREPGGGAAIQPAETGGDAAKASSDTIIAQNDTKLHGKITEYGENTSQKLIMELLSKLPEFNDTPPETVRRLSGAIARAAADGAESAAKWPGDAERIAELIGKMFVRPTREGGGERLRQVRDEILVRLTMLEEEISRARMPVRETAAAEAQKLIEHVRALQNVGQYVYMQIPVKLGEDSKTAELYVFRQRKGAKRFDPDNVNILLSVDLTYLGHWESLVNIRGRDVSLRMEVKSGEAKKFFSGNTVKLHNLLNEAGFRLTEASVSYSDEETNPLTALSSLLRFKTGNNPRIDLAV